MNKNTLVITYNDYIFLNDVCNRNYTDNSMSSNASSQERNRYLDIQHKLKDISRVLWTEYFNSDHSLKCDGSSGNPLNRSGSLKWPWSCVFKGSNKQYGAQISIIFEPKLGCMKVGFFFGGASRHNLSKDESQKEMKKMKKMARNLKTNIAKNNELQERFYMLETLGFEFSLDGLKQEPDQWLMSIVSNPIYAQITASIPITKMNDITIDSFKDYYSQIAFLLNVIDLKAFANQRKRNCHIDSDTRKRRLDILERIGKEGEEYIMALERQKLRKKNILRKNYPKHVALYDDSCGYDILSLDDNGREIFIEVKSTVYKKGQKGANIFFMSDNEWQTYLQKGKQYKLYRVYGVGDKMECERVDLGRVKKKPLNYIIDY